MAASTSRCVFCGTVHLLSDPSDFVRGSRSAFDPWKGRLWNVCRVCGRWSAVPLELRWETLEHLERAARERGRVRLSSTNLSLIGLDGAELVRVGRPPRTEMAAWRYGDDLPAPSGRPGFFRRVLNSLPPPPLTGYRPYGLGYADPPVHWVLSPFQDSSWGLTLAFTSVPLAPTCPSCDRPLALRPWSFHELRLVTGEGAEPTVLAPCALCETRVEVPLAQARPALRLGLSVVAPRTVSARRARRAASGIDEAGGVDAFAEDLSRSAVSLGDMVEDERLTLSMALDEHAELDALEREWRDAEELAGIMDGELTRVPGFEAFRRAVLAETGGSGT